MEADILKECDLLSRCRRPNVVAFRGIYETKKAYDVVMEYCPAGEWFDTVRDYVGPRRSWPLSLTHFTTADFVEIQ